jgi:tetratricopeptide (TPR) repeat protein
VRPIAVVLIVAVLTALPPATVGAIDVKKGEELLLPEFCRYTQSFSLAGPGAARWVEYMGNGFWAMHHYCWGLVDLMRSERASASAQERRFFRQESINEFDYVLARVGDDFVLRPDILAKKGEVLRQLSRYPEATECFREAIALRPKYEAAYYGLAETIWAQGQVTEALAIVDEGVARIPDARFLPKLRQRIVATQKR